MKLNQMLTCNSHYICFVDITVSSLDSDSLLLVADHLLDDGFNSTMLVAKYKLDSFRYRELIKI